MQTPSRFHFERISQITDVHCGPAVLQMLLAHNGISTSQNHIVEAAGDGRTIDANGTRIDHMARAVKLLAPHLQLWAKEHTIVDDLNDLVTMYQVPVGVEWQNLFYQSAEEEYEETGGNLQDSDFGHYSIVVDIDPSYNSITMADPYPEFVGKDRYFPLDWFVSRWWDYNEVKDPLTSHIQFVKDDRLCFIITQKGESFPKSLGMEPLR